MSPHEGSLRGWNHKDWGDQVRVEGLECGEVTELRVTQDAKGDDQIRAIAPKHPAFEVLPVQ